MSTRIAIARRAACAALAVCGAAVLPSWEVQAAPVTSVDLGNYVLTGTFFLPVPSALEASAIAYNHDTDTLSVLGDEGDAIVEVSKTGAQLSVMTLTGFDDTEGLTYVGGGQFVLAEERLRTLFKLTYTAGGSVARAGLPNANLGSTVGNIGIEGVSYDPRDGTFVTVKETAPQEVNRNTVTFGTPGTAVVTSIFNPASLGLIDLSDVQLLAALPSLIGTPDENNMLIFSQESAKLLEVGPTGAVLGMFSLAGVVNAEGITIDRDGVIYIVDENDAVSQPRMFVLAPVPLPAPLWLLGSALFGLSPFVRRKHAG